MGPCTATMNGNQGRLLKPFFIFHRKYFSNPTFIHFAQTAFLVYELCLGGSTGYAFISAAVFPISMRQTTLSSSARGGGVPVISDAMVSAAVFAILTVIKPVFGTPVGTGVTSGGAIAIATPMAKMFLYFVVR